MPSDASIDIVLSWSRDQSGTTAVLMDRGDGRYDELGRTDATEFTVEGLTAGRAYVFAAAPVESDGDLAPQEEWEQIRVAPLVDDSAPARPTAPTGSRPRRTARMSTCVGTPRRTASRSPTSCASGTRGRTGRSSPVTLPGPRTHGRGGRPVR